MPDWNPLPPLPELATPGHLAPLAGAISEPSRLGLNSWRRQQKHYSKPEGWRQEAGTQQPIRQTLPCPLRAPWHSLRVDNRVTLGEAVLMG